MKRNLKKPILYLIFSGIFSTATYAQTAKSNVIQDNKLPELLKLKSEMTVNNELADRYKIQLFYEDFIIYPFSFFTRS